MAPDDIFRAKSHLPVGNFELRIYNRYSENVFTSNDSGKGWHSAVETAAGRCVRMVYALSGLLWAGYSEEGSGKVDTMM
mgnify:CR=1 FL=1